MRISLFITLVGLLLGSLAAHAKPVKYFSMNLHCGLGDWARRMDMVIAEIVRVNPDVIGLQEVCYNSEMNMQTYILQGLQRSGYQIGAFHSVDTHRSFSKYMEQLLIISKQKAVSKTQGYLPGIIILRNGYVGLEIEGQWVVTTHLHFLIPFVRQRQYKALRNIFSGKKAIIFGDMNSSDRQWESGPLRKAGWTSHYEGPTYPSDKPRSIFDGFWLTSSFSQGSTFKSARRVFLNAPEQPSDHLGLELNLDLQ